MKCCSWQFPTLCFALVGCVLALGATAPMLWGQESGAVGYKMVIHADNPTESIERGRVSKYFLKRLTSWEHNDRTVLPMDLAEDSAVREAFTKDVHKRSVRAVQSYWLRMVFSGDAAAPPEVQTDAEVLAFVGANPSAIGYVSATTALPSTVKGLEIVD